MAHGQRIRRGKGDAPPAMLLALGSIGRVWKSGAAFGSGRNGSEGLERPVYNERDG
jgi:hypothetical protein